MGTYLSWLLKKPFIRELLVRRKSAFGKSRGRIVVRHRAAGVRATHHVWDRFRLIWNLPGMVIGFEWDLSTKNYFAVLAFPNGIISYVPATAGQAVGDVQVAGWDAPVRLGNVLPLEKIPLNINISFVEARPGSGAVYARSPGALALIIAKNSYLAKVLLKNGVVKFFDLKCLAVVGRASNIHWKSVRLKKAGQTRLLGGRPRVRGVAKNPVDHPHGGGKGKKSKNAVPEGPWGRLGARKKKHVKKYF